MKYEVVQRYVDRHTKEFIPEGATVELTDERAKELKDYVKPLAADKKEAKK